MMGRLFGTDGARGIANTELTCETAMQIGRAAALVLTEATHHRPCILIGKDTRASSSMLESAITAGLCSVGADVRLLGEVPTPAVAYLVGKYHADAGVMISASHNPCEYNGIKLFNGNGFKLSDELEAQIEAIVLDGAEPIPEKVGGEVGRVHYEHKAAEDYIRHIIGTVPDDLSGLRVAVDCANGSASVTAKRLFESLGAEVHILHAEPDGVNINQDCGSTHMQSLSEYVKTHSCHIGVALDGDADRCLAVDESGSLIDGDQIIAVFADDMKKKGTLRGDTVVVTVMSNLGFYRFCEDAGIKTAATQVGDRYVLEEMLKDGYKIGGEQSGHIIFLDYATTGDGQLTAVQLLSILKQKGCPCSEMASLMERFPQVLINVKVEADGKARFATDEAVMDAIKAGQNRLGRDGRILVRLSGTEPLIRVMAEGKDAGEIEETAQAIAGVIRERLA